LRAFVALLLAASPAWADLPAPVTDADYAPVNAAEARLGWQLFYDPILSGNRNIACATCHHPRFGTSDGLSLGLGEGGIGLGPDRHPGSENVPELRIPRNSPALFNLGATQFTHLFDDGRIEADPGRPSGFRTPMDDEMVAGFASALSAQAMFPVLSSDEMAGHYSENEISKAVRSGRITGAGGAWDLIAARVASVPEYKAQFGSVYAEIAAGRDLAFTDIANAIAAFVAQEWRSDSSPFDTYLRGQGAFSTDAERGMTLFYGSAGCAECHSGPFQTDHAFHAMAAPQLGPGKAERFETHSRDEGRFRVTGRAEDLYAFRTPSLRNVLQTGPWGHAGAHSNVADFLAQHGQPQALPAYQPQAILPELADTKPDWAIMQSPEGIAAIASAAQPHTVLNRDEISALLAFLAALTDPVALQGRLGIPETLPSGLPVDR
jgi:cytochrome c peroxidase